MNNVKNKLRVMHYAQVPCKPFIVDVSNEQEAKKIMDVLADQHLFLLEQNIIPDYSNALTVVMWDENADGEDNPDWVDYWNDEEGMDFDEFSETYLSNEVGSEPLHLTLKYLRRRGCNNPKFTISVSPRLSQI